MTNETCNFYDLWMLHAPIANDRFGSQADREITNSKNPDGSAYLLNSTGLVPNWHNLGIDS